MNGLLEIEIEMYTVGGFRFILPDLPIFSDTGVVIAMRIAYLMVNCCMPRIYINKRRDIGKIVSPQL
ncbi:hypothetical protein ACJX0J_009530, partial [Zea mays]